VDEDYPAGPEIQ